MKKYFILSLLFACALKAGYAQNVVINGAVKNEQGSPVRYAFVEDKQLKTATYTDSLGAFRLTVNPASQLMVTCNGYADASMNLAGRSNFDVVLKADAGATGSTSSKNENLNILNEAFQTNHTQIGVASIGGLRGATFSDVKETRGSRFLFNSWVHGYAVKTNGEIIQGSSIMFNYDKMEGDLFLTANMNSVLVADKNVVKSFVLFGPQDQAVTFERMTGISDNLYSQVISSGSKYKIYKLTTCKFIPSNYKTDGVMSTGNLYDEYADQYSYFISNVATGNYQQLNLRKKAIIEAFAPEGDKAASYIAAHRGKFDDVYLKGLGDAMNQ